MITRALKQTPEMARDRARLAALLRETRADHDSAFTPAGRARAGRRADEKRHLRARLRNADAPRCPDCGDTLTDRTTTNDHPSYCDTCDCEVEPCSSTS
jgi:hypothetical protein